MNKSDKINNFQLYSTLGNSQKDSFCKEKFFEHYLKGLICHKRSDKKK